MKELQNLKMKLHYSEVKIDILKRALRNKIARHEISTIKKGKDVDSIID